MKSDWIIYPGAMLQTPAGTMTNRGEEPIRIPAAAIGRSDVLLDYTRVPRPPFMWPRREDERW